MWNDAPAPAWAGLFRFHCMSAPIPASLAPYPAHLVPRAIATALLVILLGALDQTIVTIAVPTMARELGDVAWMAWVVSSYLVAATVVTPLYGRYGDQHGRRKALTLAVLVFLVASVACALAQTMPQLVWARVAQGIGGGGLLAGAQALIADVVTPRERGRYQGWIAGVWAFANVAGPVLGGLLTHRLSWHWVFWINLPLCGLALWLIHDALRPLKARGQRASSFDALGAAWLVAGLAALLVPVTRIGQGVPLDDTLNSLVLASALPLLAGFVWHEQRVSAPILPLGLLAHRIVASCSALGAICYAVMITMVVMVPLRAQWVQGLSVDGSAWQLMCMSMGIPSAAFLAGRYMYRTARVRPLLRIGTLLVPAALLAQVTLPASVLGWVELPGLFVLGMGLGLQLPTTLVVSQHAVGPELVGTATSLSSLCRQIGGAVGLAVLSALLLLLLRAQLPAGHSGGLDALVHQLNTAGSTVDRSLLDGSFRAVLWGCLACSLLAWPLVWRMPETRLDEPHRA